MNVRSILEKKGREVHSVEPDLSVFEAISKMSKLDIGALVVIKDQALLGIISERDYRNKVILKGRTSKKTTVQEIMTSEVYVVSPDETVERCMTIMTQKKFRHLPVVENDRVTGVISIGDLVKTVIDKQKIEIKELRRYIAGSYPG
ncbi:MAG: CBS domain-containing protein [Balneolaceae bacterium]